MVIPIVFEDGYFLIINKPAGVVVNRAESAKGETVQDWAERRIEKLEVGSGNDLSREEKEFNDRAGIIHRLDKDTSGLLLIAKKPASFIKLKDQFQTRSVVKKYASLVHGQVEPSKGEINAPIERNPYNRKHFGVFPGGREATTEYKVAEIFDYQGEKYSLLELTPHTGRTHQIRVHLKYINHPIVSDPIYGGRKNYQDDLNFCPRLFLHAEYLAFKHPETGEKMEFKLDLPGDLQNCLRLLK